MFEVIHRLTVQIRHRKTVRDIAVDVGELYLRKAFLLDGKFLARHIAVLKTHLADPVTLYRHFLVPAVDAVTLLGLIHAADDLAYRGSACAASGGPLHGGPDSWRVPSPEADKRPSGLFPG